MPKNGPIHIFRKPSINSGKIITGDKTIEEVIRNMARAGLTDKEMAQFIGVRLNQLRTRLKRVPALEEALVEGRSEATQQMVAHMYKVAIGGQIVQEVKEKINAKGEVTTEIATKELPPNPQLMMFWLTNAAPDQWKTSRQLAAEESQGMNVNGNKAESDKIARLCREIFEGHSGGPNGKHKISEAPAHAAGEGKVDARDLRADVQGEAADNVQDDVLDVPAETRAEPV